jgi:hypothetical protein
VDWNQVSMEARQLSTSTYPPTWKLVIEVPACSETELQERHHTWSEVLNRWSVARRPVFHEGFVFLHCKPVLKYVGSE